jgi:hypothetical protein
MRLITSQELSQRSDKELQTLFNTISQGLTLTEEQTPERRNALATLENIQRAWAKRPRYGP